MSLTKVSYSMIQGAPFNVVDYGADPTGTIDSTAAFQAAIDAAEGYSLVANGDFLISDTLNLKSNSSYIFYGATLTPSGSTINAMFSAIGLTDVRVFGGRFICVPGVSPILNTHPTGTYYSGAPFYFQDCTNVVVKDTYTYRYFTVIDVYNCSDVLIQSNVASDCAGGYQAVARGDISSNYICNGITFADNIILHAGDDALTLLTIPGQDGEFHTCKIIGNFVSKNPGVNGTIGLSKPIALYGDLTTRPITNTIVSNNTAYFCGEMMIQAAGLFSCSVSNNSVNYYGMAGVNKAFWVTDCLDTMFTNNTADNGYYVSGGSGSLVFDIQDSNRCRFVHNHGVVTANGQGAILVRDDSDENLFDGNVVHNLAAYCLQFEAGSDYNQVINNDFSVFVALAVADAATGTYYSNNRGYVSFSSGSDAVPSGASSVLVVPNLTTANPSQISVVVTPTSTTGNASKWWVDKVSSPGNFYVKTNANPTSGNFTFDWTATKII